MNVNTILGIGSVVGIALLGLCVFCEWGYNRGYRDGRREADKWWSSTSTRSANKSGEKTGDGLLGDLAAVRRRGGGRV